MALDEALLIEVVRQNCAIKAAVVGEDERESDYRADAQLRPYARHTPSRC